MSFDAADCSNALQATRQDHAVLSDGEKEGSPAGRGVHPAGALHASGSLIRRGSHPDFCPPAKEGIVLSFEDDRGERVDLEFLGLLIREESRFGFFFPISDDAPALSSGELVLLEVTALDEEGQAASFELVDDPVIAAEAYDAFREATKDIYRFA